MVKPNETCPCDSGKKYKKCCMQTDEAKRLEETKYEPSEMIQDTLYHLTAQFPEIKFKDVTDKLNSGTYKSLQIQHMKDSVCLIAERTAKSEKVFKERDPEEEEYDLMLMLRGAYRILHGGGNVNMYIMSLKSFFADPLKPMLRETNKKK